MTGSPKSSRAVTRRVVMRCCADREELPAKVTLSSRVPRLAHSLAEWLSLGALSCLSRSQPCHRCHMKGASNDRLPTLYPAGGTPHDTSQALGTHRYSSKYD